MEEITKDTTIEEVLEKFPMTVGTFMEYKIPSLVCGEPLWGTVEEVFVPNRCFLIGYLNQSRNPNSSIKRSSSLISSGEDLSS